MIQQQRADAVGFDVEIAAILGRSCRRDGLEIEQARHYEKFDAAIVGNVVLIGRVRRFDVLIPHAEAQIEIVRVIQELCIGLRAMRRAARVKMAD